MKRVVSVSLGSSRRDKKVEAEFFGEQFSIERIGTDGDKQKYRRMVADLDGKVDAFGVGGCDIYLYAGARRYVFREPMSLMAAAKLTPFVDGSGLKHTLERKTVARLQDDGTIDFSKSRVLLVSAVDRFGMAEALAQRSKSIVFGDMLFGLGLPFPIRSWSAVQGLARLLLPIVVRCPFQWFYPTGEKQHVNTPKHTKYFAEADVIAGDYLLIGKYMPEDMRGKTVLTNTTTADDVEELGRRGVERLITTTPVFDGRSFGTNVMEAVLVVLMGRAPADLTPDDYLAKLSELGWKPQIQQLNPPIAQTA
ncbi:MAG: quinate 5-dehydrogenase [Armatimonadetes bacterium]|nr:quinate 5-dehydrogenase [Armatimonadota bacterium]MDE2205343.1 quinate 5-dehydrogenase [Armatimonadota bacterium]